MKLQKLALLTGLIIFSIGFSFCTKGSYQTCSYETTITTPQWYKGLEIPSGSKLTYETYVQNTTCGSYVTNLSELAKNENFLSHIVFPANKPLVWGGMPVEQIFHPTNIEYDYHFIPKENFSLASTASSFAKKWQSCGKSPEGYNNELRFMITDDTLLFKLQKPEYLKACGQYIDIYDTNTIFMTDLQTAMHQTQIASHVEYPTTSQKK